MSSCCLWAGVSGPGLLCSGVKALLGLCSCCAVYAHWAPLKSCGSWEAFWHPVLQCIGPMLGKATQLQRYSPPTYMCMVVKISSNSVTTVVWFSVLLLNICWAFLAQHGRTLSCFMACLVLTTSEIPTINMLALESKPITGVSAAYNYTHGLIFILCQLIITANLCIFKVIYCHKDEPDDLISMGFMIHMMYSNWC